MPLKSFRDLIVWQKSKVLVWEVYNLTRNFPRAEQFGITAQLRRAAVSVPVNIAEGYGRSGRTQYLHFLSIARGSLNEIETLLDLCHMLGFGDPRELDHAMDVLTEVRRMLIRLREALMKKPRPLSAARSKTSPSSIGSTRSLDEPTQPHSLAPYSPLPP